jgi:hypothetical protein
MKTWLGGVKAANQTHDVRTQMGIPLHILDANNCHVTLTALIPSNVY